MSFISEKAQQKPNCQTEKVNLHLSSMIKILTDMVIRAGKALKIEGGANMLTQEKQREVARRILVSMRKSKRQKQCKN